MTVPGDQADTPQQEAVGPRARGRRWGKRIGWLIALILGPVLLAAAFFASPIGKRFIADQIAAVAPASGLRFKVGRIEGDIYGKAVLRAVEISVATSSGAEVPMATMVRPMKASDTP